MTFGGRRRSTDGGCRGTHPLTRWNHRNPPVTTLQPPEGRASEGEDRGGPSPFHRGTRPACPRRHQPRSPCHGAGAEPNRPEGSGRRGGVRAYPSDLSRRGWRTRPDPRPWRGRGTDRDGLTESARRQTPRAGRRRGKQTGRETKQFSGAAGRLTPSNPSNRWLWQRRREGESEPPGRACRRPLGRLFQPGLRTISSMDICATYSMAGGPSFSSSLPKKTSKPTTVLFALYCFEYQFPSRRHHPCRQSCSARSYVGVCCLTRPSTSCYLPDGRRRHRVL